MKKVKWISLLTAVSLLLSLFSGMTAFADEYTWDVPEDKITDSSIIFQWKDWDGNTVCYKVEDRGSYTDVWPNSEGIYSFTMKGLDPSTTYSITVIPIHPDNSWGSSRALTAKTKSASVPSIGEVNVGKTSITVNLDNVSETGENLATVFDVTNGVYITKDEPFTGTQFTASELTQFTKYTITIQSTTDEFPALTTTKTTQGARVTERTDTSLKIEWDVLDPLSSGHAYYWVSESWKEIMTQQHVDGSPLVLSNLKPDTEYEIKLTPLTSGWGWCGDQWVYPRTLPAEKPGVNDKVKEMRWNNDKGEDYYTNFGTELAKQQTVYHRTYESALLGTEVGYNIYLPASYDASNTEKRYPVIYMLHGLGGDENTYIDRSWGFPYIGALQNMSDNVIIVFVNNADYGWYTDSIDGLVKARSTVIEELIPHIDATYNTIAEGKSRAIDGFSMGGQGALTLAFEHPDMFASVIAYAPGLAHSLQTFVSMNWSSPLEKIFNYSEDSAAAEEYYQSVNAFAALEKNKAAVAESGMKIKLVWGDEDPVGTIAAPDMYDALTAAGINTAKKVISGFNHNSPYYGNEGIESTYFHTGNLSFEGGSQGGGEEEVTELTVVETDLNSVTLKWPSFSKDYDFYKVYTYQNGAELKYTDVNVEMGKGGSAVIKGLQPGTKYTFTVWGGKTADWSLIQSRTIAATTLTTNFPYLLSSESTINSVTLTYDNIPETDVNYMSVYKVVSGSPDAEAVISNQEFTGPVFVHSGLGMGEQYKYVLTPKDTAVGSWDKVETTVKTKNPALSASATHNKITISITDVSEETECVISAVKTADQTPVLMNSGQETETFTGAKYNHTGLEVNTKYTYTVAPADAEAGWGPLVLNTKTTPEYALTMTAYDEASASFSWVAVDNTAAYKILLTSDEGTVPEKYTGNGTDINELSHTLAGLDPNCKYNVRIIALRNGDWNWQYTYSQTFTTLAHVDGFEVTRQGVNELSMRWPAVDGAAYFNVYQLQDGKEVQVGTGIDPVERTFKKVWLKHNTEFTFTVRAFDAAGTEIAIGGFENTLTARTKENTKWNVDLGAEYYSKGKLEGQNVRHETYYSELMDLEVGYNIHTPAGYNPEDTSKRYPVLYYLHPLGGNENAWVSDAWGANYVETLQTTEDNMFIVYVNNAENQWYTDAANGLYYGRSTILYELIPHIDRTYNTIAEKRGRALDGFSMGGVGGLILAFERPDMFNSVVTNSAAVSNELQDFANMAWGSENAVFGRDVDYDAAERYYAQEGIYGIYEKNRERIAQYGLNVLMRWGEVDPVAMISNQRMYETLSENAGVNITREVIANYDHSSVYYDGGRMYENMEFHKRNLDFSGSAPAAEFKIGSVNTALGDVFLEKGAQALPADAKLLISAYDAQGRMSKCQVLEIQDGVKTDFAPIADARTVKVFIWSMENIAPVSESKTEPIL